MYIVPVSILFIVYLHYVYGWFSPAGLHHNLALGDTPIQGFQWIDQPLDHFDPNEQRTFRQRYRAITCRWRSGGPIFITIGAETSLPGRRTNTSLPEELRLTADLYIDLLRETNGASFHIEHRYYGKSKPFQFEELNAQNLVYLTSKQALADVANLIKILKSSDDYANSKVVVIGGSYAGNLAAWMKVRYPDIVDAVLASSGPVLAKKDFTEYFETVTESYRKYGSQDCVDKIAAKFNRYDELIKSPEGIEKLKQEENICSESDMTVPENQQLFFSTKMDEYASKIQYAYPDEIMSYCRGISEDYELKTEVEEQCVPYDFKYIRDMFHEENIYQWTYQTCNEFGYFMSSSGNTAFTKNVPVDFYVKICSELFGSEFDDARIDQGVANTNQMYGGLKPAVDHVVFTNGDIDPWHRLAIVSDVSADAPAIYIQGASHCADLAWPTGRDSQKLQEARPKIKNLIKQWIGSP